MLNLANRMTAGLCLVILAVCVQEIAMGQDPATPEKQRMTPELMWKLARVGTPAISPDGTMVAWSEKKYDLASNNSLTDVWAVDWRTGERFRVLSDWKSVADLQWTGDGERDWLWFAGQQNAETPATPQIFRLGKDQLGVEGSAPQQLSQFAIGVSNLKVAPNGGGVAFTSDIKLDATVAELYADLPKADARIIDSLMYRHWDSWHDYAYSHLHVAWLAGEALADPVDLMPGQKNDCPVGPFGGAEQIAWSPDSKWVAYTTKLAEHPAESTDTSVWLIDPRQPATSARDLSSGRPGYDNNPFWSADGKRIGFHSMVRPGFEADRNRVMVYDLADGKLTEWTTGLDQNANSAAFTPDGNGLTFVSEVSGTEQIFRMPAGGPPKSLTSGDYNWNLVGLLPGGEKAVVLRQTMLRPDELYLLDLQDGSATQLSHANDELYAGLELPTVVSRRVTATDGREIQCWVALPPDFGKDPGRKWPMILFCQGGPQAQISQSFSWRWNFHLMAARGYVVAAPNRRGLPGFGQAWNDQISGDWGGQAMRDLLSVTDDISREPWIDTARRSAVGASFGGYSVYWLMGNHGDRFRAMIAHCGVFNLESMYGSTEELFFVNWDLGGPYWKSEEIAAKYQAFSPHRFVRNWKTPLLVIHGEKDFRVPVTQGMEAFTVAQTQRIPSRFLYFPEEGHWVLKPQNSVLWQRVFFQWLEEHCGEPGPASSSTGK